MTLLIMSVPLQLGVISALHRWPGTRVDTRSMAQLHGLKVALALALALNPTLAVAPTPTLPPTPILTLTPTLTLTLTLTKVSKADRRTVRDDDEVVDAKEEEGSAALVLGSAVRTLTRTRTRTRTLTLTQPEPQP